MLIEYFHVSSKPDNVLSFTKRQHNGDGLRDRQPYYHVSGEIETLGVFPELFASVVTLSEIQLPAPQYRQQYGKYDAQKGISNGQSTGYIGHCNSRVRVCHRQPEPRRNKKSQRDDGIGIAYQSIGKGLISHLAVALQMNVPV